MKILVVDDELDIQPLFQQRYRKEIKKGNMALELYNLENDIKEENDVSNENIGIINKMTTIMENEHEIPVIERFIMAKLDSTNITETE